MCEWTAWGSCWNADSLGLGWGLWFCLLTHPQVLLQLLCGLLVYKVLSQHLGSAFSNFQDRCTFCLSMICTWWTHLASQKPPGTLYKESEGGKPFLVRFPVHTERVAWVRVSMKVLKRLPGKEIWRQTPLLLVLTAFPSKISQTQWLTNVCWLELGEILRYRVWGCPHCSINQIEFIRPAHS